MILRSLFVLFNGCRTIAAGTRRTITTGGRRTITTGGRYCREIEEGCQRSEQVGVLIPTCLLYGQQTRALKVTAGPAHAVNIEPSGLGDGTGVAR